MPMRRTGQETIEQALNSLESMVSDQYSPDRSNRETSILPRISSVHACRWSQNDPGSASLAAPGRRHPGPASQASAPTAGTRAKLSIQTS
jgi:hypothetical protein